MSEFPRKKLCLCDSHRKQMSEMTNDICCNACGGVVITTQGLVYHMLQCGDITISDFIDWKSKDMMRELKLGVERDLRFSRDEGFNLKDLADRSWKTLSDPNFMKPHKFSPDKYFKTGPLDPREALHLEKKWKIKHSPTLLYTNNDCHLVFGRLAIMPDQLKRLRQTFEEWEEDPYKDWETVNKNRIVNIHNVQGGL